MVDCSGEVAKPDRLTLGIGNRDKRHFRECLVEMRQVGQILPAVQRRDSSRGSVMKDRKVELVDMKMEDVELVGHAPHSVEHHHVIRDWVAHVRIEPQRTFTTRNESSSRVRFRTGEECDVMPLRYQRLSEEACYSLRTPIGPRWNTLDQRSDLRDFHDWDFTVLERGHVLSGAT